MEEDLKLLEDLFYEDESYEPNGYVEIFLHKEQQQAIENLLKRYKELEEENKELKKFADITLMRNKSKVAEVIKDSIFFEYIPISVIQNKIDELKSHNYKGNLGDVDFIKNIINEFEELLEEREK